MADVKITEYRGPVVFYGGIVPVGMEPSLATQTVTSSVSSASSNPMNAGTRFVRIVTDGNVHFKVAADDQSTPTAATTDAPIRANVVEYFGIPPGFRIAFIDGV